jgi:hypothetical protein
MSLYFFKKGASVFIGLWIVDEDPATFASYFLGSVLSFFTFAFYKGCTAAGTLTFGKEPSLDWGNDIFEHFFNFLRLL